MFHMQEDAPSALGLQHTDEVVAISEPQADDQFNPGVCLVVWP